MLWLKSQGHLIPLSLLNRIRLFGSLTDLQLPGHGSGMTLKNINKAHLLFPNTLERSPSRPAGSPAVLLSIRSKKISNSSWCFPGWKSKPEFVYKHYPRAGGVGAWGGVERWCWRQRLAHPTYVFKGQGRLEHLQPVPLEASWKKGGIADPSRPVQAQSTQNEPPWMLVQSSSARQRRTRTEAWETTLQSLPCFASYTCSGPGITAYHIGTRLTLASSPGSWDTGWPSHNLWSPWNRGEIWGKASEWCRPLELPSRNVNNSQKCPAKPHRLKAIHLPNLFSRLLYGAKIIHLWSFRWLLTSQQLRDSGWGGGERYRLSGRDDQNQFQKQYPGTSLHNPGQRITQPVLVKLPLTGETDGPSSPLALNRIQAVPSVLWVKTDLFSMILALSCWHIRFPP